MKITTIDKTRAAAWVTSSLLSGSNFSKAVLTQLDRMQQAIFIGEPQFAHLDLDNQGHGASASYADRAASEFFDLAERARCETLLVEDDRARKGDPSLEDGVAFVGDRVVAWTPLSIGSVNAAHFLSLGSSGHPLNAYITRRPASSLGIASGESMEGNIFECRSRHLRDSSFCFR